ncbi:TorD/DmsD family molecular chaperone [Hydrogenophilus thiooxidans]|uniref:TorD/DmsD family molecular chaperone n=1 Tax=Hydrogenophilus thiooxidans TaxID=2820326 RepID=UPI001C24DB94|nr:molecular chaperone TorD family protein [Hydrogenophilus thiooxidans]
MLSEVLLRNDRETAEITQPAVVPQTSPEEQAAECRARAAIYRLLAAVFVEEVTPDLLQAIRSEALLAQLAEVGIRFDDDFTAAPDAALLEALAAEYTALFACTGGFPPVESVRLYGLFQQEPAFQVAETYRQHGFVLKKGKFATFPDQLGVELSFVAELLERAADALENGDVATQRKLEKTIKRFWAQHLGLWVRGYGRLVQRAAAHSFYREMGRFLTGFAEEEIAAMGLKVEDRDQGKLEVEKIPGKVEFNPDEPICNACVGSMAAAKGQGATVSVLHDLR